MTTKDRITRKEKTRVNDYLGRSGVKNYQKRNSGDVLLFRESGKPQADFYPTTGKWRSGAKTYEGGVERFVEWYHARQTMDKDVGKAKQNLMLAVERITEAMLTLSASFETMEVAVQTFTKSVEDASERSS